MATRLKHTTWKDSPHERHTAASPHSISSCRFEHCLCYSFFPNTILSKIWDLRAVLLQNLVEIAIIKPSAKNATSFLGFIFHWALTVHERFLHVYMFLQDSIRWGSKLDQLSNGLGFAKSCLIYLRIVADT